FKAKIRARRVGFAFAAAASIEMIPGIKLHSRLSSSNLQNPPRFRIVRPRSKSRRRSATLIEHVTVIVPKPDLQLLIVLVNSLADCVRLKKIKRRPPLIESRPSESASRQREDNGWRARSVRARDNRPRR